MATQTHDGRAVLTDKIIGQLGSFVNSTETAIRNNLPNRNVLAETTLKGLLNLIHGWDLVNANSIRQNYPGIDLIDTGRKIGIQVTSTNSLEKVKHTLEQVEKLPPEDQIDRLYILTITNDAPTASMQKRTLGSCFSGETDIWNIPQLLRQMMDLDISKLEDIHAYLDAELGTLQQKMEQRHLVLRPVSAIGSGFVGRHAELAEIQRRIDAGEKLIVLSGLGGMGKTELAVKFGLEYEGAAYFTRFKDSFTHTLAEMAYGIRPKLSKEEAELPEEARCEMVLNILEKCGEKDILIIDNVDSDQGRMNDLLKDAAYRKLSDLDLRLLMTTRFERGQSLSIDRMEDEVLFRFFEMHETPVDQAQMKSLIDAVNGHTLTIDLIARTLADNWEPVTAEEMLNALENSTLAEEDFAEVETYYNQSQEQVQIYQHLRAVFQVAKIPEAEQNILRCATLLPENGMYFDLFRDSLPEDWRKSLAPLGRRGWLTKKGNMLTIHSVIRLVCREELKPTVESCEDFLNMLWEEYDPTEYSQAKFTQMAILFVNTLDVLDNWKPQWLNYGCILWLNLDQYSKVIMIYKQYLSILETRYPNSLYCATAHNNIGNAYQMQGNHRQALKHIYKSLSIRKQQLPKEHPLLAISYGNVGNCYSHLGNYTKALEFHLKALTIHKKTLPPNHIDLASSYNNIGMSYSSLGNYQKALECNLSALHILEGALAHNHPKLISIYSNVGYIYGLLGDYLAELEYQQKALVICQNALPNDHPSLALCYNNIGFTYSALGDHYKAIEYTLQAVTITKASLPEDYSSLAQYYNNLGSLYRCVNDFPKALEYFLLSLALREKVLPEDHPDLAFSYNNLGNIYGIIGNHQKALEYNLKALAIREKVLPKSHPDLATSYDNLGVVYYYLNNYPQALNYLKKALEIRRKILPVGHPEIAVTESNLVALFSRM